MNEAQRILSYHQRAFDQIFGQLLTPLPDPEPLQEAYGDLATWRVDHKDWEDRQGDELAKDTSEGCCGDS